MQKNKHKEGFDFAQPSFLFQTKQSFATGNDRQNKKPTFRIFPKIHEMKSAMPKTPYYAVIFTSTRTEGDNGYHEMSEKMVSLASLQDGFLGVESAREEIGITVSYWRDLEVIKRWRAHTEHTFAREKGRADWYQSFNVRIAKVEHEYEFHKD